MTISVFIAAASGVGGEGCRGVLHPGCTQVGGATGCQTGIPAEARHDEGGRYTRTHCPDDVVAAILFFNLHGRVS